MAARMTTRAAGRVLRVLPRSGQGELEVEIGGLGPAVVFVHGWAVDRRMWAHQLLSFRRTFTTITYDRRGFGQSSAPADLGAELDDLDSILDRLELPRAALVGMSQGGRIVLSYASSRSSRVTGLVVQGAPLDDQAPPAGDPSILPLARYASLARADRAAFLEELGGHPLMGTGRRFAQVEAEIAAMLRDYRAEDLLKSSGHSLKPLLASDLARITAPALVITGSKELLWLRGTADRIARSIRGARRRNIRGGGHFVNMTHVRDYNTCVGDFLRSTTRPWSERALGSA
jgi:3-oxoadipate enol-lactonase